MKHRQQGSNDCGVFVLAYIESIINHLEPSLISYKQETMRTNYNNFIDSEFQDYKIETYEK